MKRANEFHRVQTAVLGCTRWWAWYALLSALWLIFPGVCVRFAAAQEALLINPPFDQIVIDEPDGEVVLDVYPLDLPERRVPATPQGELTVQLVQRPGEQFQVRWSDVKKIKFYEQLLLERAVELTKEEKFDEAFDYYSRLLADYPQTEGLDAGIKHYLRQNSLALYQQSEFDRALALLGSLYDRDPNYAGLATALDRVSGEIIKERLRQQEYAEARDVLDMMKREFGRVAGDAIQTWQQRFRQAAETQVATAREHLTGGRYADADQAARRALTIWPELDSAKVVLRTISRQYPQVLVGVLEQAPKIPQRRLDSWADLRVGRLVHPTICQLKGFGEGGIYDSPYGEVSIEETDRGRRLSFQLSGHDGAGVTADVLARELLAMASPTSSNYRSDYASICGAVSIDRAATVYVDFVRPHVRPEAMLLGANIESAQTESPFSWSSQDENRIRFERTDNEAPRAGLRAISEVTYEGDNEAFAALVRGEVSVLDHVPPWMLARLESRDGITVGRYLLPTVHVLVPDPNNRLLSRREFRRALVYGIDRQRILEQIICGGSPLVGFQVISGPFPPGGTSVDPVRYAYDSQIEPRPYSPRLAATLSLVAVSSLAKLDTMSQNSAESQEDQTPSDELPEVPTLVLAHSTDPVARAACDVIAQGLRMVGIPIELRELSTDELLSDEQEYDLRYAELAVWEPVADASTMFGQQGLFRGSAAMNLALRDLHAATNWVEVRRQLNNIHRIAHNDLPVIPLWQTVNHFAYRSELTGVDDAPVTLYQHVEDWKVGE